MGRLGIVLHAASPRRRARAAAQGCARAVLNGVLWILRTGAQWRELPRTYPPYQTCHRRFQQWRRTGLLRDVLEQLAEDLRDRGQLDLTEDFIDGTFSPTKKGAPPSDLPSTPARG
jgi:transposase